MRRTALQVLTIGGLLALGACQISTPRPRYASEGAGAGKADAVPMLVRSNCAACHAIIANLPSPNPTAPGFADIANTQGLTRETLVAYLQDAHNYPDQMDVELTGRDAEVVADYMMTLRNAGYRRIPS